MGGLHTVFFFVLLLRCRVTLGNSFPFAVICFICLENGSAVIGLQMVWRHGVVYEQYSFKLKLTILISPNEPSITMNTIHSARIQSLAEKREIQSCQSLSHIQLFPINGSTPGFPACHQLLELAKTHLHPVGDAIQPSHPLSSPSPPAFIFLKILNVCSKYKHLK